MKTLKTLEIENSIPSKRETHKKWKTIARELSDLNMSYSDLANMSNEKPALAYAIAKKNKVTTGEMILLRQIYKAIEDGDTRAAEFLRDTMGENPKQVVEVQKSTISQMTDEEIEQALEDIKNHTPTPTNEGTTSE